MSLYRAGSECVMWESGCLCQRRDDNLRAGARASFKKKDIQSLKWFTLCLTLLQK